MYGYYKNKQFENLKSGNYYYSSEICRPEARAVQSGTSVIRVSPNPRQWSNMPEQQSVILQHALTSPPNQIIEPESNPLPPTSNDFPYSK